jgi:hypothetical protein
VASRKRRLFPGGGQADKAKPRPAQCLREVACASSVRVQRCKVRTCESIYRREAAGEVARRRRNRSQKDALPVAAQKGESEDNRDEEISKLQIKAKQDIRATLTQGAMDSGNWIQKVQLQKHRDGTETVQDPARQSRECSDLVDPFLYSLAASCFRKRSMNAEKDCPHPGEAYMCILT